MRMKLGPFLAVVLAVAIAVPACTTYNSYDNDDYSPAAVEVAAVKYDPVSIRLNDITNQYTIRLVGEKFPLVIPANELKVARSNTGLPYVSMRPDGSNVVLHVTPTYTVERQTEYGLSRWIPYSSSLSTTNYVFVAPPPVTRTNYTTIISGPGVTSRDWSSLQRTYKERYNVVPVQPSKQISNGLSLNSFKTKSASFKQKAEVNRQAAKDLRLRNRSTGGDSTTINNSRTNSKKYDSNRPSNSGWGSRSTNNRSTSSWGSNSRSSYPSGRTSSSSRSGRR